MGKRKSSGGILRKFLGTAFFGGVAYGGYKWLSNRSDISERETGPIPTTNPTDKNLSDLAPTLAKKVVDDLNQNGLHYDRPLLSSFQATVKIQVDGLYGPQSAHALKHYEPSAPEGLRAYGGTWDGISSQVTGTPSNVINLEKNLHQSDLARQIATLPEGQERRYLIALFQRAEKLPVTGQLTTDAETSRRLARYA